MYVYSIEFFFIKSYNSKKCYSNYRVSTLCKKTADKCTQYEILLQYSSIISVTTKNIKLKTLNKSILLEANDINFPNITSPTNIFFNSSWLMLTYHNIYHNTYVFMLQNIYTTTSVTYRQLFFFFYNNA